MGGAEVSDGGFGHYVGERGAFGVHHRAGQVVVDRRHEGDDGHQEVGFDEGPLELEEE